MRAFFLAFLLVAGSIGFGSQVHAQSGQVAIGRATVEAVPGHPYEVRYSS